MKKRIRPKPPFRVEQRVKLIENQKRAGTVKRVRGAANYHYWYVDVKMDDGEFIPSIHTCWLPLDPKRHPDPDRNDETSYAR